mgnify:CR=1 FL=1
MGGTVKTALNIVCFPEKMDLNILGKIMQGGADKVIEAGGTLAGGHSIADSDVKYDFQSWVRSTRSIFTATTQGSRQMCLYLQRNSEWGLYATQTA